MDNTTNVIAEIVTGDVKEKISIFENFFNTLPQKAFDLGLRVIFAFVIFIVGIQIIKLIRKIVKKSLDKTNADLGVIQFLDSLIKTVLLILLLFMIASRFGLDATSIIAVIGSAGVAVGLALQGSLSNFAGGVLILLLKPFRVGDYIIEDNNKNEGTVKEIQLFYTRLITPDEKTIILPNGTLANTSLTNVTATDIRRLDLSVGISYNADIKEARSVALNVLNADDASLKDMEIGVYVSDLADSAVQLTIRCYVKNENFLSAKARLLENIKLAFDDNNIEIPYNQIDVHVNKNEI